MTTKRQSGWQKLFLILTVLPCCSSLKVSALENEYEVASGGDVTLACSFIPARPIENILIVTWEAYPDIPTETMQTVATYYLNNRIDITPPYEGRASMEVNIDKQETTLTLTKVTIQDSRRYQCSLLIPGDDEGTTAASTSLLVLVPPSPPICNIKGTAEYGHNISLTCLSEEASPEPEYKWMTYSVDNIQRQFPPKTTEKDGLLSLFNVSRETSGFFICTSTNRIGSANCNVTLSVMPGSMNGSTVAIVAGVIALALVVVLGIVVYCCCKKGKKDKNVEGSPEEEYNDGDLPETGGQYRDDKNEKSNEKKQLEETQDVPLKTYSETAGHYDDDQYSHKSAKDRYEGKGSDIDSRRYQDDQHDQYRGSRDRLDDKRNHYSGSRDRLDDQRGRYGSRDRLDDQRDRYGSRDRLDDRRDRYGGSRDRLDDRGERYDDRYDARDRYGGSRDRLDDRRDRYGGSRDRLDDNSYRSSDRHGGSRDGLAYADD